MSAWRWPTCQSGSAPARDWRNRREGFPHWHQLAVAIGSRNADQTATTSTWRCADMPSRDPISDCRRLPTGPQQTWSRPDVKPLRVHPLGGDREVRSLAILFWPSHACCEEMHSTLARSPHQFLRKESVGRGVQVQVQRRVEADLVRRRETPRSSQSAVSSPATTSRQSPHSSASPRRHPSASTSTTGSPTAGSTCRCHSDRSARSAAGVRDRAPGYRRRAGW